MQIEIRLSPGAKASRLTGIADGAGGRRVIRASVVSPPEDGRANEALLKLLARSWRLPRRDLSIVRGFTSRNKAIYVAGDPQQLIRKISAEIANLPGW
ncbi:MAG: DUF167 domain-containing protein [Stellaceae bacterium]